MKNTLTLTTPSDLEIVVTRRFNAPRQLVWDTMTETELKNRWLTGPPGWAMTTAEADPRTGGTFRAVWSGPGGEALTMSGEYREVTPPERCVRTEKFEMAGRPTDGRATGDARPDGGGWQDADDTHAALRLEGGARRGRGVRDGARHGRELRAARRNPRRGVSARAEIFAAR